MHIVKNHRTVSQGYKNFTLVVLSCAVRMSLLLSATTLIVDINFDIVINQGRLAL